MWSEPNNIMGGIGKLLNNGSECGVSSNIGNELSLLQLDSQPVGRCAMYLCGVFRQIVDLRVSNL